MFHRTRWRTLFALSAVLACLSCGNCGDPAGNSQTNSTTDDAGPSDTASGDDATSTDGDAKTGDGGDDSGDATAGDAGDGVECDIYSTLCDGECIPTSTDPDNCGDCGEVCADTQVCLGGRCVDDCLPGLTACDRRCVDVTNDSSNCDQCGETCDPGQGCVDSECVDGIDVDFDAAQCDGGGPVIELGSTVTEEQECAANLAEHTFRFGVCSCNDFSTNNELFVDAYDSRLGPYVPGGLGGGVGANGSFINNDGAQISGSLWIADNISLNNGIDVGQRLLAGGDLSANSGAVGRDAFIAGEMDVGTFGIEGALHLSPGVEPPRGVTYGSLVNDMDVAISEPCTECPPDAIDVAGIVDAFANDHDNSLIGLDPDVLNPAPDGPVRLDLPCGKYVLNGIESNEPVTIVAHGNTALFIDGDVSANNPLTITLTPDAQLDVFVSGNVNVNNEFKLGSPNYPALLRVYVGGDTGFTTNNPVTLAGFLYAVPGSINANNEVEVYGGLYANDITANNPWNIHYDRRVTTIGNSCGGDGSGGGGDGDGDAGMGGGDGGPVDVSCTTEDGACSGDGDCCSPLTCENGMCALLDCVPASGSCTDDAQCCSGVCSSAVDGICVVN